MKLVHLQVSMVQNCGKIEHLLK